jgi:hypothetical protein
VQEELIAAADEQFTDAVTMTRSELEKWLGTDTLMNWGHDPLKKI